MSRLLASLKVWQKSLLPVLLAAAVAGGLATYLVSTLSEVDTRYKSLLDREAEASVWAVRINNRLIDAARLTWRAVADENSDPVADRKELEALVPDMRMVITKIDERMPDAGIKARVHAAESQFITLHKTMLEAVAIADSGRRQEGVDLMRQNVTPHYNRLRLEVRDLTNQIVEYGSNAGDAQAATVATARTNAIYLVVSSILGVIGLGIWVAQRGIVAPINALSTCTTTLAAGQLNTTVPGTDRRDEIGIMALSVETFRQGLIEVERLKAEQETLKQRAEVEKRAAMNALADHFQSSVGSVVGTLSSASTELTAAAGSMASIAEETSRQATTVASASEQASVNVQTVAAATDELAASVSEISRQVSQSTQIAGQAMGEVAQTNQTVQGLTTSVARISEVVRLISEIASQTNLLALNATIEAARAGDAGKGFAVVASEVKHLATQTARATEDITGRINEIQSATGQSVEAIDRINKVIQQMNEISLAIASAVEEQGAATQEIARNVAQAADGTQLVSANILQVTQASAETGTAASQVQASSAEVAEQAEGLKREVDSFLHQVRAA